MDDVKRLIETYRETVRQHHHWLHEHPELSHEEKNTAAYIAQALRAMGLEPQENIGGYGVTAVIEGKGPGKCIGLRADFDALPITECTGLPYSSQNPGVAHSCGHDAHTAMLLGAACILRDLRDQFSGSVKLIFQPSEEDAAGSGAKAMVADGVLENPKVDAVFGQHVQPEYPAGTIALRNGVMNAASDRFFITIRGKNSHGSAPENGIDAIVIAAQVISALQTIVSRNVGPLDSAVVTIGTIRGGNRYNVIADEVVLEGTCRNLNLTIRESMPQRIEGIVKGIAEGMGGSYEFRYVKGYSPMKNDPALFSLVEGVITEVVGADNIRYPEHSSLGGEDFCFYGEQVPTAYYLTGVRGSGQPYYPLHNGHFAPDEAALPVGMEVMIRSALRFLGQ